MLSCITDLFKRGENDSSAASCSTNPMYEPNRHVLDFTHIEQINTIVFHYRELSRNVTTQLGVIPNTVVAQLRSLNQRIVDNIDLIEGDLARNERAPFEAKLEYYQTEYQEMNVLYQELINILYNTPPPPPPEAPLPEE